MPSSHGKSCSMTSLTRVVLSYEGTAWCFVATLPLGHFVSSHASRSSARRSPACGAADGCGLPDGVVIRFGRRIIEPCAAPTRLLSEAPAEGPAAANGPGFGHP